MKEVLEMILDAILGFAIGILFFYGLILSIELLIKIIETVI
jgi:hypothetical protein